LVTFLALCKSVLLNSHIMLYP